MTRLDSLTSWNADWRGLRVAVLGAGSTGFAAADTLVELGADVTVFTQSADSDRAVILGVLGIELVVDPMVSVPEQLEQFAPELIVTSPGFHPDHPVHEWARANGVAIWGDIELAWRVRDKVSGEAEWILVTGTNGKTTTTQLTAHFLAADGKRVAPCGNIGVPVLDAVRDPSGFDVFVVELSSYQLHTLPLEGPGAIVPWATVCLNVAHDHIDWHGSFEAYTAAKAKVYNNTKVACVYNRTDEVTMHMVEDAEVIEGARAVSFGLDVPGRSDFGIVDGILCDRAFLEDRANTALELITIDELIALDLAAPHIVQNILAAAALARSLDVSNSTIHRALGEFRLDSHRIRTVALVDGIRWVDDSKATNPHAANASLRSFEHVVWVVGGLLKGVDLGMLVELHKSRLRAAIVIGAERSDVLAAFERHAPEVPVIEIDGTDTQSVMPRVVAEAAGIAVSGDTVLLAPAAASMDQFSDYADRGEKFSQAVWDQLGGGDEHPDADSFER
ncbi:MAG TPA: UDP-N-acetylmuramoyl-L-alanine--D-glutamate ligase [Microbacteriaceae bacterium]|nr:UDP-N-acetylmuramoyl-L-alanine--D-glutamate ligase [Microbacteriaceae bacterium]